MPPRPHPLRSLLILSLAALAFALAQTTLIPALTELARELDTDAGGVAWTVTGYLLSAAVCTPIFGRLGDMFGKRRLLVVALAIFGAGSVVSALGTSLEVVVAGRFLQGAGGGIFPLCFGIIRDEFPREKVATGIGLISAIFGIGGGAGLILSGLIVDRLPYEWIFWLALLVVVAAAIMTWLYVPESPIRAPARIDWLGAMLMTLGLVLLLLGVSEGNEWGWSSERIVALLGAGVAVLALWTWFESRADHPLVDMRMMRRRGVWTTNVTALLVGFGMFGAFILTPQLVQAPTATGYGFGASVSEAGLFMLPSTLVMLIAGPVAGWLGSRVGSRVPVLIGTACGSRLRLAGAGALRAVADPRRPGRARARDRLLVRRDGERDRRGRRADRDGRRDRDEHDHAHDRRLAGRPDRRQHRGGAHRRGVQLPGRGRLHGGVRAVGPRDGAGVRGSPRDPSPAPPSRADRGSRLAPARLRAASVGGTSRPDSRVSRVHGVERGGTEMIGRIVLAAAVAFVAAMVAAPGVASAGGFSTVGLETPPPAGVEAGQAWEARFTLLAHGREPMRDMKPVVRIEPRGGGAARTVAAIETDVPGTYGARVAFPTAGRWSIEIAEHETVAGHAFGAVQVADGAAGGGSAGGGGLGFPGALAMALALGLLAGAAAWLAQREPSRRPAPKAG